MLSLELILHILQHSGPAFKSSEKIIYAIRNLLCVSLLGNCTSQIAQVTGLSLQIFVALMDSFKDHLKSELEVFVTSIFLRILESENSTYEHKLRVLEVFHSICKDPSAQIEIFINYDCDLEAIDLFRRIVDGFAKIAKVNLARKMLRNLNKLFCHRFNEILFLLTRDLLGTLAFCRILLYLKIDLLLISCRQTRSEHFRKNKRSD